MLLPLLTVAVAPDSTPRTAPHHARDGVSSGPMTCQFSNGTRSPEAPLPAGYFGPEPCLFKSDMVLRANDSNAAAATGACIWGSASPGETVVMALDGTPAATATADATGRWELTLQRSASATAHTLTFTAGKHTPCDANSTRYGLCITLERVLFGTVILCSGQSNMDFSVAPWGEGGCLDANETVAAAAAGEYDDIRLMHGFSSSKLWFNSSYDAGLSVGKFSAVCFLTAVQMKKVIPGYKDHPIGLIQASVGGTIIEEWMSPAMIQACEPASDSVPHATAAAQPDYGERNSDDYFKMISPLAPASLSAVLWYQAENNVAQNFQPANASWQFQDYYACLFRAKIQGWRAAFRSPDLFYAFVQLAAYSPASGYGADPDPATRSSDGLPRMRLDQSAVLSLPNTAMAMALDLGDNGRVPWTPPSPRHGGIHPRNKTEVGRRLALSYAAVSLGMKIVDRGPQFSSATLAGSKITVHFSSVDGGIALSGTAQCTPLPCCAPNGVPRDGNGSGLGNNSLAKDAGVPFEIAASASAAEAGGAHTYYDVLPIKTDVAADGKSIELEVPHGVNAIGVRYCHQSYRECRSSSSVSCGANQAGDYM